MYKADRRIIEVKEMKNLLEQYVYDNRAYISDDGERAKYAEPSIRDTFLSQLNQVEDWLYNDG
jgi:heat shock 70kDa protein 4